MLRTLTLSDGREITLRRAGPQDSDRIYDLYEQIYQGSYTLAIVNDDAERLKALEHPDFYWLVADTGTEIVGSVIFEVDPPQKNGKVFAAITRPDFRKLDLMYEAIGWGIQRLMHDWRICDVIYATTRTASIGPSMLLKKLGFMSLGIFPNVHRLAEHETHGLNALFHPEAFANRRPLPQLIPEVEGFYRIIRRTFHLEPAEIRVVRDLPRFRIVRGEEVRATWKQAQAAGELLFDFFPFHEPNFLFTTDDGSFRAWINYEGSDGHGVVVALKSPKDTLKVALEAVFLAAQRVGVDYLEILIDAYEPWMQQAALSAQYRPCAYFPSMEQVGSERKDFLVFAKTTLPLNFSNVQMTPRDREFLDVYLQNTEYKNLVVKMHFSDPVDGDEAENAPGRA